MVAKRADSAYRAGRSPQWKKLRSLVCDDFVVVGFTPPRGSRPGFGALHVAIHSDGELRYRGRVGTGFSDDQLVDKLKAEGIDIARRTVAKYRKQLNIPAARQRREY